MRPADIAIAVLVTAIWGLNFSVIKLGLQAVDPLVLAGIRFTLCALPVVFFVKRPAVSWLYIAGYGLVFGFGVWGVVTLGIHAGVSAGVASLTLQFSAFFSIILAVVLFGERLSRFQLAGMALALGGLGVIIGVSDGSAPLPGVALVLVAAICWSFANLIVKKSGAANMLAYLAWSSLFAPIPLFALAYATKGAVVFTDLPQQIDASAMFSTLFQAYPTTIFGYWVWNSLLKQYPLSTVAPLSLLVPVFGLLGSAVIFGEAVSGPKLIAAALILSGLIVGLYGRRIAELRRTRSA